MTANKCKLTFELPEDVVTYLGSTEGLAAQARRVLILDLLREARISQGKAAQLLGVTRGDILDLMVQYSIPSGLRTADDVAEEVEVARQLARER